MIHACPALHVLRGVWGMPGDTGNPDRLPPHVVVDGACIHCHTNVTGDR